VQRNLNPTKKLPKKDADHCDTDGKNGFFFISTPTCGEEPKNRGKSYIDMF
jgi:hypothetical protein